MIVDFDRGFNELEETQYIFSSANEFSEYVETLASHNKETILETLKLIMDELGKEPEEIKSLISTSLKGKLKQEFVELGMLPKEKNTLTNLFG